VKRFLLLSAILLLFVSKGFSQNSAIMTQIEKYKQKYAQATNKTLKAQYLLRLGNLYKQIDSVDQAIVYFKDALSLVDGTNNYLALMQLNNYLGFLYSNRKADYASAEKYFANAVKYARKQNDKQNLANALINLANTQKSQGKYDEAIKNYEELLSIVGFENLYMVKKAYANMAECYKAKGDNDRYMKYYNLSVSIDQKIKMQQLQKKEEEARRQADLAKRRQLMLKLRDYQLKKQEDSLKYMQELSEKKSMQIKLLENEKKLKDLEMQRREAELKQKETELKAKKIIIYSLAGFLFILLIASLFIYKLYVDKKKANRLLVKLNKELEEKNEKIARQKEELEIMNKRINESIEYASKIQHAILPSEIAIKKAFVESFILYLPRDVVSGDFYWYSKQNGYEFVAGVDCTGHSVPGAFMSMIGYTLLNEIVNAKKVFEPKEILTQLHKGVLDMLHKNRDEKEGEKKELSFADFDETEIQDGMSISLMRVDKAAKEIDISIADQKIISIAPDGKLTVYEGSIFAIGGLSIFADVEFTSEIISYDEGTVFYLFSDGFIDQFGQELNEKFSTRRFKKLLQEIYLLPLEEQKIKLVETLENWRGDVRQMDDIMVIGLKL